MVGALGVLMHSGAMWSLNQPHTLVATSFPALFATGDLVIGIGSLRDAQRRPHEAVRSVVV